MARQVETTTEVPAPTPNPTEKYKLRRRDGHHHHEENHEPNLRPTGWPGHHGHPREGGPQPPYPIPRDIFANVKRGGGNTFTTLTVTPTATGGGVYGRGVAHGTGVPFPHHGWPKPPRRD